MTYDRSAAAKLGWERRKARLAEAQAKVEAEEREAFLAWCVEHNRSPTSFPSAFAYYYSPEALAKVKASVITVPFDLNFDLSDHYTLTPKK